MPPIYSAPIPHIAVKESGPLQNVADNTADAPAPQDRRTGEVHFQLLSDDGYVEETAFVDGAHEESDRLDVSNGGNTDGYQHTQVDTRPGGRLCALF